MTGDLFLLYVVLSAPVAPTVPPTPNSIRAVHETRDQARCEGITALINTAPSNGQRYECRTVPQREGGAR